MKRVALHVRRPGFRRRLISRLLGLLLGGIACVLYFHLLLHRAGWQDYVIAAVIGAMAGLALATFPVLIWDFFRKHFYRLLLRQWTDKSHVLAQAGRRRLQEEPGLPEPQVRNDLAVIDFLLGHYAAAVEGFREAAAHGVIGARANLLAALTQAGQWDQLAAELPHELEAAELRGEANLARLALRVTAATLRQQLWQLAEEKRLAPVLNNLGVYALRHGEYAAAARAFQLAIQFRPGYGYPYANQGVLAYRQGNLAQAIAATASAVGLLEDETVYANLGALLAKAGDLQQAEQWLEKAHRLEPRNAAVLINLGSVYSQREKPEEAVQTLRGAEGNADFAVLALYNLGRHYATHDVAQARHYLEEARALAPEDPDILNTLAALYYEEGQYETARECLEQAAAFTEEAWGRRNLIRAELAAGHIDEAERLLREYAEPEQWALERGLIYLLRAFSLRRDTRTHQQIFEHTLNAAASAFTEAMIQAPAEASLARLNYACAQFVRGEYLAAAESFADALKTGAPYPEMYYLTGVCYILAGLQEREQHESSEEALPPPVRELFQKARPFLDKALDVPAVAEATRYDLALLYYWLGDYQKAIDLLRQIVRPDSPVHVLNAIALAQAKLAQKLQLTAQTASLMSESRKREVRQRVRRLLSAAIRYFGQALGLAPHAPMLHANIGLALMLRNDPGDVEAALRHWQAMHERADDLARRTYEEFMQAMSAETLSRLSFQDVDLSFRPVNIRDWIRFPPLQMAGFKYIVREAVDEPAWELYAQHRLVRQALVYRQKAERLRRKLKRLTL